MLNRLSDTYHRSSLLKSGTWYTVGTLLQKGLVLLTIPLFAQLLSTDDYGTVFIFLTWQNVFAVTITLNLAWSVRTAWYDFAGSTYKSFVSSITSLGFCTSSAVILVLFLIPGRYIEALFRLEKPLILLAATGGMAMLAVNVQLESWRIQNTYKALSATGILYEIAKITLSILLIVALPALYSTIDRAESRIGGLWLATIILGISIYVRQVRQGRTVVKWPYWRYAVVYAAPLILHYLSTIILAQFDRVMIDQYFTRADAGVYSFAYQLGDTVGLLWGAANSAWLPWFFDHMNAGKFKTIHQRSRQYLFGFTALTVLAMIGGTAIVPFITPPEYWPAMTLIPIIMAAGFMRLLYAFYLNVELYEKQTAYTSIGTVIAALVNVGLNLLLLPRYGYEMAAWTTLSSYIVLFVFHVMIVKTKIRKPELFNLKLQIGTGIVIVLFAVGVSNVVHLFLSGA